MKTKFGSDTLGTERMIIDNSGNVGIGTSSPTTSLAFGNTKDQTISVEASENVANGKNLSVSAGSVSLYASDDFVALNQTSRNWFGMTIAPNGDVYASVRGGDIYKTNGRHGKFLPLGKHRENGLE